MPRCCVGFGTLTFNQDYAGSIPVRGTQFSTQREQNNGSVGKRSSHHAHNMTIAGSNPAAATDNTCYQRANATAFVMDRYSRGLRGDIGNVVAGRKLRRGFKSLPIRSPNSPKRIRECLAADKLFHRISAMSRCCVGFGTLTFNQDYAGSIPVRDT